MQPTKEIEKDGFLSAGRMPKDTNGVHFFTPSADHDEEETAATSPGSEVWTLWSLTWQLYFQSARAHALDSIRDYGMSKCPFPRDPTLPEPALPET